MTTPKKRRSGPSGPSGEHRQEAITLRAERDGQVAEWRDAAERADLTLSAWVRSALDEAAKAQR